MYNPECSCAFARSNPFHHCNKQFIKVLLNSGVYGLAVELNLKRFRKNKPKKIRRSEFGLGKRSSLLLWTQKLRFLANGIFLVLLAS